MNSIKDFFENIKFKDKIDPKQKSIVKKYKNLIIFVLVIILCVIGFVRLTQTSQFIMFVEYVQQHRRSYFIFLITFKMAAIVWPPLPGGLITVASIPVIGWFYAWLADYVGGLLGASIAFLLAKYYGENFLHKVLGQELFDQVKQVKINKKRELEAIIVFRLLYGTISEVVSYGLGLLKVKFSYFFFGTAIAGLLNMFLFWAAHNVLEGGKGNIVTGIVGIVALVAFFKLKGRYFE